MKPPRSSVVSVIPLRWRARVADLRGRGLLGGYQPKAHCFFIHIPRTGGTSAAVALFGSVSSHAPYFIYQREFPDLFAEFFKFCFVRNPWDRLVSTYFFLKAGGMGHEDAHWARENLSSYSTFEDFVYGWLNDGNIWTWVHFLPQTYFVVDGADRLTADFVGRFETIERDFTELARRLGQKVQLPRTNGSRHRHYSLYYNEETKNIVRRVYAKDIETFGYSFCEARRDGEMPERSVAG
jgi:chondroitin 4-sulfotransferase 11